MTALLDLENLRDITGGDRALERELFAMFVESSDSCLAIMRASCGPEGAEEWQRQAHAWKGLSLNLGAAQLGDLCRLAQERQDETAVVKAAMLTELAQAYDDVRAALARA